LLSPETAFAKSMLALQMAYGSHRSNMAHDLGFGESALPFLKETQRAKRRLKVRKSWK